MTVAWILTVCGVMLALLAIIKLTFGYWVDGLFRRAIGDHFRERALAQHARLMIGVKGAEFGDFQPIDLDSDDVLKFATVTLPDELDIESHWGSELLRRPPIVQRLRDKADLYLRLAERHPHSESRYELRNAFLLVYANLVETEGIPGAISSAEANVELAVFALNETPYYRDEENRRNTSAMKRSGEEALSILRDGQC